MAPGKIDGSVVPTASAAEQPKARIAGVEITAPPTPKVPDITPVAMPANAVSASRNMPASTKLFSVLLAPSRQLFSSEAERRHPQPCRQTLAIDVG